ncbi:MAG: restriction endonuclease [Nitrospira sp.]
MESLRRSGSVPVYGTNGRCGSHDEALFKGPGVILGRKGQGPLGVEWSSDDYWVIDTAYSLMPRRSDVDLKYAYFLIKHIGLNHLKDGTSNPTLSRDSFGSQALPFPPLGVQHAIAHILGTLDDKIELNRQMNETLETMARALFKSWFIDFDPVRRNAARARNQPSPGLRPPSPSGRGAGGEGVSEALFHPLPLGEDQGEGVGAGEAYDHLFPDSFEDSELGETPKGWEVGRFGDVVDQLRDQVNPGLSPDVLFRHFSIPAFDEGQTPKLEYGESIKSLKSRVPAGVVLLSKLNPELERVWLVDVGSTDRSVCSTEFLVLSAHPPFTRSFVYCLARSPFFRQQIESLVTGTSKSHQRAQVEAILNLPVVLPPSSIVAAFDRTSEGLLARTLECRRESRTLVALRDTLLPKLISGELQIKDAERFIEARVS